MSKINKTVDNTEADRETVLMALDQLSQTMDVMRQVVGRLKRRVEIASRQPAGEARYRRQGNQANASSTPREKISYTLH